MKIAPRPMFESMAKLLTLHRRHPPAGAMPGTLVAAPEATPPVNRLIAYGPETVEHRPITDPGELRAILHGPGVAWVDVQGLGDEATLRHVGEIFSIHPLALEDAVNVPQRPKSERYDAHQLFITRMTRINERMEVETEQVSIFFGARFVLTLQEHYGDVFDPVRRRIQAGKGLIRQSGPDYLAYALIDTIIDEYFPVAEALGDQLSDLEEEILARPTPRGLRRIHRMRRQLLGLRRAVWPQREAVSVLIREESPLVTAQVKQYLRDCHDHTVQIADVIETYRELAASLMDIYLSSTSQRTNEVMKVLTIMASIFIPLTFVAGVYGMNFEHLPELKLPWAYPALLGLMVLIAVGMLIYFRRRGWIGSDAPVEESEAGRPRG